MVVIGPEMKDEEASVDGEDGDYNGYWLIGQEGQEVPMKMISANGADQLKNGDEEDAQLEGNVAVRERRS